MATLGWRSITPLSVNGEVDEPPSEIERVNTKGFQQITYILSRCPRVIKLLAAVIPQLIFRR